MKQFSQHPLVECIAVVLLVLFGLPLCAAKSSDPIDQGFALHDFLGRRWQNERVRFPLSADQLTRAQAGHGLIGPDHTPVPYQIVVTDPPGPPAIEFLAALEPYESRTYRLTSSIAPAQTDLHIEETSDVIRLGNSRIGIALRKILTPGEGPIASLRLASGRWIGNSLLKTEQHLDSYAAAIITQGPAVGEVVVRMRFREQRPWALRFRIQAHEPVILVDETFALGDASAFVLVLNHNFAPNNLFYRNGKSMPGPNGAVGRLAT
jgi:hypothetical protein